MGTGCTTCCRTARAITRSASSTTTSCKTRPPTRTSSVEMVRPRRVEHFVGVLGWPLRSTLSPAIHNAAFRRLGLDWVYLRWPVSPEALDAAVGGIRALGATGANVTMPHKETVMDLLDELSGDAAAIGAVNTIQCVGGLLVGHNTDVDGF